MVLEEKPICLKFVRPETIIKYPRQINLNKRKKAVLSYQILKLQSTPGAAHCFGGRMSCVLLRDREAKKAKEGARVPLSPSKDYLQ